ncbi:MAG: hypothetical protein IKS15_00675 [Opitutales bacterium]|nr:hypothetical protein [Opitutales bacterium]
MRGFFACIFGAALCAAAGLSAQTYEVKVKTVADKTSFPDATFIVEIDNPQMKGFEGAIRSIGFGGEGLKPTRIIEREMREKYTAEMKEELAVKDWDKLDTELDSLEREVERREKQLARASRGMAQAQPPQNGNGKNPRDRNGRAARSNSNSRNGRGAQAQRQPSAEAAAKVAAEVELYKYQDAYQKAKAEYDEFKAKYDKAKRTRSVLKEMIAEIDEKISLKYKKLIETPIVPDGTYPYGTFCAIDIKKADSKSATVDFEYAISRIIGWVDGEGTNNNNSMNSSLDVEYIEMPKKEGVVVEFGKPYCFQIARPEKSFGTLEDAKNKTSIFSESGKADASMDEEEARRIELANPLNAHGDMAQIRAKFKGKEKRVIRAVVTITKIN